jgi:hypothetical protein
MMGVKPVYKTPFFHFRLAKNLAGTIAIKSADIKIEFTGQLGTQFLDKINW